MGSARFGLREPLKDCSHPNGCFLVAVLLATAVCLFGCDDGDKSNGDFLDQTKPCENTPGWTNGANYNCTVYEEEGWCIDGQFWGFGWTHNYPEKNCCACYWKGPPASQPTPSPTGAPQSTPTPPSTPSTSLPTPPSTPPSTAPPTPASTPAPTRPSTPPPGILCGELRADQIGAALHTETISLPVRPSLPKPYYFWAATRTKDVQAFLYDGKDDTTRLVVFGQFNANFNFGTDYFGHGLAVNPSGTFLIVQLRAAGDYDGMNGVKLLRFSLPSLQKEWEVVADHETTTWDTYCRGSETMVVSETRIGIFCSGHWKPVGHQGGWVKIYDVNSGNDVTPTGYSYFGGHVAMNMATYNAKSDAMMFASSHDWLDGPTSFSTYKEGTVVRGDFFAHWGGGMMTGLTPGALAPEVHDEGFGFVANIGCRKEDERCPQEANAIFDWYEYKKWRDEGIPSNKRRGSVRVEPNDKLYFAAIDGNARFTQQPTQVFPDSDKVLIGSSIRALGPNRWLIAYSEGNTNEDHITNYHNEYFPSDRAIWQVVPTGGRLSIIDGNGNPQGKPVDLSQLGLEFPGGTAHLREIPGGIGWIIPAKDKAELKVVQLKCKW